MVTGWKTLVSRYWGFPFVNNRWGSEDLGGTGENMLEVVRERVILSSGKAMRAPPRSWQEDKDSADSPIQQYECSGLEQWG